MTELKPCPFCGSLPIVDTKHNRVIENQFELGVIVQQRVIVKCPRCFCMMDLYSEQQAKEHLSEKEYRSIQKQLARNIIEQFWNARA